MRDISIASGKPVFELICDSSAIPSTDRLRYGELRNQLSTALISWQEIAEGYVLQLNTNRFSTNEISEWISLERHCCPWLSLEAVPGLDQIFDVRMTGPDRTKEVLRMEFAELFRTTKPLKE